MISFVRQVMTKKREFLGRIVLSERHFGALFHVHASRNLSNDRGKQSREDFESEKSKGKLAKDTPRNSAVQNSNFTIRKRKNII